MVAVETQRELIHDPHFQQGFILLDTTPGKRVVHGTVTNGTTTSIPAWDLAQWSSKFPLEIAGAQRLPDGTLLLTNEAKRVVAGSSGIDLADLLLRVNGHVEYGDRARKTQAEPWVHLLVQQDFDNAPSLAELSACCLHAELRLNHSQLFRTPDYSASKHAAQYFIYFSVANRNRNSPGYGQYFWFGIPVYDDRQRIAPAYQAQDFGETKMFIYTPAADVFAQDSPHDGKWVNFDADLLPLMVQGLNAGWKGGFMPGSRELADYRIAGIFIGWEVPGIFDVEIQLRNLSLLGTFLESAAPSK